MRSPLASLDAFVERTLIPMTVAGLGLGLAATAVGQETLAVWAWTLPALVVGIWLLGHIIADLLHKEAGVDVIAVLAIAAEEPVAKAA